VLLAAAGYLLVTMPGTLLQQYRAALELGETWARVYLAAIVVGAALLVGASGWLLVRIWLNSLRKRRQRDRSGKNPSQLSREEQQQELTENITAGRDFAAGEHVSESVREELRAAAEELEQKWQSEKLEIVAFGTISSGKSSLLNALAGRELFPTDARGGTTLRRNDVPWPGNDRVVLADTPGLAEVDGEQRAALARTAAADADLVLFVVDGPLRDYESETLEQLAAMEKRLLVCLNKQDWYPPHDRERLLEQISRQVGQLVKHEDVVVVQSAPATRQVVRVLADGSETRETVTTPADISPLADRLLDVVQQDGRDLLLGNLLLQSRGLVERAKDRVRADLDRRAEELIGKYMWAAGGAAAVNPVPLLDIAGGGAVMLKMALELARVYRQPIDTDAVIEILAGLSKNLIALLGVTAATPAIASTVAALLKTVPGVGTIAGGILQGLVQALVTRWVGRVLVEHFRNEMTTPSGGMADLARRKWNEVTQPQELIRLVQQGRQRLRGE